MGPANSLRRDLIWAGMVVSGLALSFVAYYYPPYPFNPIETLASIVFWVGVFLLLVRIFLGNTISLASRALRTTTGAVVAVLYISVHLLLYGFVLEGIFNIFYPTSSPAVSPSLYVSSTLFYPASPLNSLVGLTFSPNVTMVVPPIFGASLSSFSIFIAVVIDLLIVANVRQITEIGKAVTETARAKAYFAMPLIGIIAGASCCMSLPSLLTIAAPAIVTLPSFVWAFYIAYFGLPPFAAVVLRMNLDVATKVVSKISLPSNAGSL